MSGIAQDVTALERELSTLRIERDRLLSDKQHLETVNGIQAETIELLQSERDRYFRASTEIGTLCEALADSLVSGVRKWKENASRRTRPQTNESKLVTLAAGDDKPEPVTLETALARLGDAKGETERTSASKLPPVRPS